MSKHTAWMLVVGVLLAGGCAQDGVPDGPVARVDEPIGVQMMQAQPQLKTQKFNNLLSFERDDDMVFVSGAGPAAIVADATRAHTGRRSVRIGGGVLSVKLSSLLPQGTFPGEWTLAGAYFYSSQGTEITISCQLGGALVAQRKLTIPQGKWTPAMLDISLLGDMKELIEPTAAPGIVFEWQSAEPVWCDDLTVINNSQVLFGSGDESSLSGPWHIKRRGLHYIGEAPGRFNFKLPLAEHDEDGWTAEEVNAKRARFGSTGVQKTVTVYSDGRAYWDGEYRPLSASAADPQLVQQHRAPGQVEVAEELGRVDRNTPGDANNDGFNEARGAWQILAAGPRLEVTLSPRPSPMVQTVLEIIGMPQGQPTVTAEGRLVEDVTRLDDGTTLIDLRQSIDRPTSISIHVQ